MISISYGYSVVFEMEPTADKAYLMVFMSAVCVLVTLLAHVNESHMNASTHILNQNLLCSYHAY